MRLSGTQEQVYQNLVGVLMKDGIDQQLAYNAVLKTYRLPDQSNPKCKPTVMLRYYSLTFLAGYNYQICQPLVPLFLDFYLTLLTSFKASVDLWSVLILAHVQ